MTMMLILHCLHTKTSDSTVPHQKQHGSFTQKQFPSGRRISVQIWETDQKWSNLAWIVLLVYSHVIHIQFHSEPANSVCLSVVNWIRMKSLKKKNPKQTKTQITKANVEMSVDTFQFQSLLGKCTKNMKKTSPSVKFSAAYLRESDY